MVQGTEAVVTVTLKYILGRIILFEGKWQPSTRVRQEMQQLETLLQQSHQL